MRSRTSLPWPQVQSYVINRPLTDAYWRRATCEEVKCRHFLEGWETLIDLSMDGGEGRAYYIRNHAGRTFVEFKGEDGMQVFRFHPGQTCFREGRGDHIVPVERNPLFLRKYADTLKAMEPQQWIDTHGDDLAKLKSLQEGKG